jgi:hypothetical protein
MEQIRILACVVIITVAALPIPASAWNIPGHMLSAAIAYQILQQENPQTIEKVRALLEKHPWYVNQWQARLQDVPVADPRGWIQGASAPRDFTSGRRYSPTDRGSGVAILGRRGY